MKKIISVIIAVLIPVMLFAGCNKSANPTPDQTTAGTSAAKSNEPVEKKSIVCTIFPQYDWVREVLGDKIGDYELTLLLDSRIDLHSYQPTVADITKISTCDLFIYCGGESDGWVEDVLEKAENKDMIVINMLETIGDNAKEEEIVEGMEAEEEEDEDEDGEEEEGPEYDEHVWLSLKNAKVIADEICNAVIDMNNDNGAITYSNNLENYLTKLTDLDERYESMTKAAPVNTVLFGDRFPFRYMVDDYDINYYAAFVGCSAETEASFETVVFLANKADELGLKNIMVIESSDKKLAETIIANSADKNRQILVLNSLQTISQDELTNGTTYLSVMEDNLKVLTEALK